MSLCSDIKNKNRIDTTSWKTFLVNDIFEIKNGKGITKQFVEKNKGKIPAIQGGEYNNGILGYLSDDLKNNKELIYISQPCLTVARIGSSGSINYQDNGCFVGDKAKALICKHKIGKFEYLFLATLLKTIKKQYSYLNGIRTNEYLNKKINLPVDLNGNPDWKYMNSFIKNIYSNFLSRNNLLNFVKEIINKNVVDFKNWKEFEISELFFVSRGKRIVRTRDYVNKKDNEYIYPVITPKITDNGIDGWYDNFNCEGNCIVSNGDVSGMFSFYQESKCWVLDTSRILLPKFKQFNKFIGLFICTLLRKFTIYFSFQRKANPSDIEKLVIKLPVDQAGNPDWKYMEDYIKSLPYSKYL